MMFVVFMGGFSAFHLLLWRTYAGNRE